MKPRLIYLLLLPALLLLTQCKKEDNSVKITNPDFLSLLIKFGYDTDNNGKISPEEAAAVESLSINGDTLSNINGIEAFVNLDTLRCAYNHLWELDVTKLTKLKYLDCSNNSITVLDVSNCPSLHSLKCWVNQISILNISKNSLLDTLDCAANNLTSLNTSAAIQSIQ